MSGGYLTALGLVVVALLGARLLVGAVPLAAAEAPTRVEAGALGVGILGLVFHCGAMFFRATFIRIPGADGAISTINAMNLGSQAWYVVAAVLVTVGLRRQKPYVLAVLGLGLVAVGVTMFNGGPVRVHLVTIFAMVTLLAATLALLVRLPARRRYAS